MEAVEFSLGQLMADATTVFEAGIGMVGTVVQTVVSHPILYIGTIIGLCGIGVAFFKRISR